MDINTFNIPYQELIRESRNNFTDYFQNYFSGYNRFFFNADTVNNSPFFKSFYQTFSSERGGVSGGLFFRYFLRRHFSYIFFVQNELFPFLRRTGNPKDFQYKTIIYTNLLLNKILFFLFLFNIFGFFWFLFSWRELVIFP